MIARWLIRYTWHPFETACRRMPLWPFRAKLDEPVPGVVRVRIDNAVTRLLSSLAGGYDYSVSYVINDAVMIDTGYPWAARELRRLLIAKGWNRTLEAAINTHYHEDHVGNNDVIAELTEARLYASDVTAERLHLPPRLAWYRQFLFGPTSPTHVRTAPERIVAGGTELEIVATPGHCPGHVCIFMPETGWLFGGDLFVAPDLDTQLPDVDGPSWIRSLEQVLALSPSALFDSHGTVVLGADAVRETLAGKLGFLRDVEARVRENIPGARSMEDLTTRVFAARTWRERVAMGDGWMSVLTGAEFSRYHLVASFARQALHVAAEVPSPLTLDP